MKDKPKILFAAFEADPFAKTGGLGDVCGSLPAALNKAGAEARVIIPKYKTIPEKYKAQMRHVVDFRLKLSWRDLYCGVESLVFGGVTFYFIDNEYYFARDNVYGYGDDGERVAFFDKAVLECLKYLPDFFPNVLHCHDWHAALIPVYLREQYREEDRYLEIKTVFTIHNLKFQGVFPAFNLGDVLGLDGIPAVAEQLGQGDSINYMRGALNYSDRITTVSPSYAEEIRTEFYSERADDILNRRSDVLSGILNGINTESYNPSTDSDVYLNYDAASFEKKYENKKQLQEYLGLEVRRETPLVVIISRLTEQKGLDLVLGVLGELLNENLQLAVLGVGDKKYEDAFAYYAGMCPKKMSLRLMFDEKLSRKFYAGADMLLMPSKFEPCGLSQMIAMRYGTLPIVRETGGLKDSVKPYNKFTGEGTGFSFQNYNAHELLYTVKNAALLYLDKTAWEKIAVNAMQEDFSWGSSAGKYLKLYQELFN